MSSLPGIGNSKEISLRSKAQGKRCKSKAVLALLCVRGAHSTCTQRLTPLQQVLFCVDSSMCWCGSRAQRTQFYASVSVIVY